MTEAEIHTLSRLLMERTGLVGAGSMAVRASIRADAAAWLRHHAAPETTSLRTVGLENGKANSNHILPG